MQIQNLIKELHNKKKKDQNLKTIEILTKDVLRLRDQCVQLNDEKESKIG